MLAFRSAYLILPILLGFILGCSHLEPVEHDRKKYETWHERDSGYRFLPGDELDVKVVFNPEFSDRVIVSPDGRINLDLIGSVDVLERTPSEVAQEVKTRYAAELIRPDVTVSPRIFGSQAIYVAGEVKEPGMLKLVHQMTVMQAIMEAGGVADTANLEQVILLRRTPRNTSMLRVVNLKEILEGRNPNEDVPVQRFDVVFVPRSDIAEADRIMAQYVDKLVPVQRSIFLGFYPGIAQ